MARRGIAVFDPGALEQRVYNVEQGLQSISAQISGLSAKLDERSKTPWATLISGGVFMLAIMSTVGVLAYRPIDAAQIRGELDLRELRREAMADMRVVKELIVPRGEHSEKWEANRAQIMNLQRQIDELSKRTGDTYTARDAILDLKQQIQDLRRLIKNGT